MQYWNGPESELRKYVADMNQLADARLVSLESGDGRGCREIRVSNGSGLAFTIAPDRGMNLEECSFRGIPMCFRTPVGHVHPAKQDPSPLGWLRGWFGGMMTSCGLRNIGNPDGDCGLHGRLSSAAADDVNIHRGWDNGVYVLRVTGELREAFMFGENLRLKREIRTAMGSNCIEICDKVVNEGCQEEKILILYHCNFGYPMVQPGVRLIAPEHPVTGRNEQAEKNIASWMEMPTPHIGEPEQCFFHELPADSGDWAEMKLRNEALGVEASVQYDTRELPRIVQWKCFDGGRYVIGLEPTNGMLAGRSKDIEQGKCRTLASGESVEFRFRLKFAEL